MPSLGEILNTVTGIYIGDTVDDFRTVANFRAIECEERSKVEFFSGLIAPRQSERVMFFNLQADIVAEDPNQILVVLSNLKQGG